MFPFQIYINCTCHFGVAPITPLYQITDTGCCSCGVISYWADSGSPTCIAIPGTACMTIWDIQAVTHVNNACLVKHICRGHMWPVAASQWAGWRSATCTAVPGTACMAMWAHNAADADQVRWGNLRENALSPPYVDCWCWKMDWQLAALKHCIVLDRLACGTVRDSHVAQ